MGKCYPEHQWTKSTIGEDGHCKGCNCIFVRIGNIFIDIFYPATIKSKNCPVEKVAKANITTCSTA